MSAPRRLTGGLALALLCLAAIAPAANAEFGIQSVSTTAREEDGSVDLRAGSHPFEYEVSVAFNQDEEGHPEGTLRDIVVELPPGLVGDPMALPRCLGADFEGLFPRCSGSTQVGEAEIGLAELPEPVIEVPIYNITPPFGSPATIGLSIANLNGFQEASLRTGLDYGVNVSDITIPTNVEIQYIKERIWGVPAEASHDAHRECWDTKTETLLHPCSSGAGPAPFLTLPTSCGGPLLTTVKVDSLQEPGDFKEASAESLDEGNSPAGLSGCETLPFSPTISAQPETSSAGSSTGLHFGLTSPQNQDPNQPGTAHLRDTVITLPAGLAVNPSAADGLAGCAPSQIDLHGPGAAHCPPGSKVGTVEVQTPLLDHPIQGSVFIATQGENPFGTLLALYIAVEDPRTGVVVKLAGKVEPDPVGGQLTATFTENPQLPFEHFTLDFTGGPRAALTTPSTCGTYTTTSRLTPWSAPEGADALPTDSFVISSGAGGGPCASTESQLPNSPSFEAGTLTPEAAAFSPFLAALSRENGSQRFGALNMTLPPGLSAKLAGVGECPEAQIAQAQARSGPGQGAAEKANPSCPAGSEVGVVDVGAGSGNPLFVRGHIYLAGPYKGAPLSLAIVTPAVAGPFDLGTVVVRAALYVDEATAQVRVKSDPIPQILQGIPLDVRSVAVDVGRPDFSLNPTDCEQLAVAGEEISAGGAIAPLSDRFQVGRCGKLGFSPKLDLQMKGARKRAGHPALRAVLTQPSGQANIARTAVILPPTTFIDQGHISNPCTRPQFAEGKCPRSSVLGKARVFTPLLDQPLEGPLYFRSNGGERELPDIVADLRGKVHIVLVGFVDSVLRKGASASRTRTTFAHVPDAPVSKAILELNGGKKGLLVNSANLCKVPNKATVKMVAHNNKAKDTTQRIKTSCAGR